MSARMTRRSTRRASTAALGLLLLSVPASGLAQAGAPSVGAPQIGAQAQPPASGSSTGAAQATSPQPAAQAVTQAAAAPSVASPESFDLETALVATDRGLTSDDAGKRARERAPQIASAEASAESARWDAKAQSTALYPQVQLSAQYRRINRIENNAFTIPEEFMSPGMQPLDFTQPVDNYTLVASARWPVSDLFFRVYPQLKASRAVADARQIETEARAASAELTAREAFYAHARAQAAYAVAAQALKQAEAQAAQAKLFVDAGTAAPVDFMTARARVESMRAAMARTNGSVAVTRNTLATLMGIATSDVSAIRERVTVLPDAPTASIDELLKRGIEQRPELRAIRKMLGANEHLKTAERNAALPVLSVEGNTLYGNPNPRYIPPLQKFKNSWEVGATLAWTPTNALLGYQRGKRASAELQKAHADLVALEDGVRIEVVQSYEDYKAADAAARASEEQRKAAEETYRVRLATYRVGAGVQIDLLTADLALTQARLDHVNAVLDARISLARLARATGGPVR